MKKPESNPFAIGNDYRFEWKQKQEVEFSFDTTQKNIYSNLLLYSKKNFNFGILDSWCACPP